MELCTVFDISNVSIIVKVIISENIIGVHTDVSDLVTKYTLTYALTESFF